MNGMEKPCPEIETLAQWVEGTLSVTDRSAVASHVSVCDECRRAVALATGVESPAALPVDERLLSRVLATSHRRTRLWWAAAAALLLVAGGAGLAILPGSGKEEPGPVAADHLDRPPTPLARANEPVVPKAPADVPPPVTAAPAPKEPPAEAPIARKEPPVPVPSEKPSVAPSPKPEPAKAPAPEPDRPLPPATGVPTLPVPAAPPVDAAALAPVFVLDPTGDLWLRRDQEEAKAGAREKMNWKDFIATRNAGAAFTLEARASVVLEKGSEAAFSHRSTDDSFSLAVGQGLVMLDTEGSTQKWRIPFGTHELRFSELNGRLAVESQGERMSALLLDGSAQLQIGSRSTKAQVGQEVVLSRAGQVVEQRVETQKKLARLDELRPRVFTAFAAKFDEKKDEFLPYRYALVTGRLVTAPGGTYLQSEAQPARSGEKASQAAELRLERPFGVVTGMVLKFRYRSTLPGFNVKIGKYSVEFPSKIRTGQWVEAEIPLRELSFEGTPMLPTDPVESVRFTGNLDRRAGLLDFEGVQFLRRVR